MKVHGQCHCGEITFEAEVDPEKVLVCHCKDCQQMAGSAFRTLVPTNEGTFRLLSGDPKIYVKTGESGNKRPQGFCADCGTSLFAHALEDNPKVYNLRVAVLRERDQLVPKKQIWCRSRVDWLDGLSTVERIDKQ
jgi:hypothetical protein